MSAGGLELRAPRVAPPRAGLAPGAVLRRVAVIAAVLTFIVIIAALIGRNATSSGLRFGFAFLGQPAGFRIGEALLPYSPSDSYAWALFVGLANTLRVAILAALLATICGVFVGIFRLSANPLLRRISAAYVELIRNTPLVLQLVLWHAVILGLPPVRQALAPMPGVFLSQRGLQLPALVSEAGIAPFLAASAAAAALAVLNAVRGRGRRRLTGAAGPIIWQNAALLFGLPALALAVAGPAFTVQWPVLRGFNFAGGFALSPEYAALLLGLVVYASAFIGEIVRSGIQSVPSGQWEGARALGLREPRILRLVVLPQAFRVIAPPLTNQYLNLTKNSSLAVVIGYPEFASITNTVINQTGHAIEALAIFMSVYLLLSLLTAFVMNRFERRTAFRGRG